MKEWQTRKIWQRDSEAAQASAAAVEIFRPEAASLNGHATPEEKPLLVTMDTVESRKVSWLWSDRIPFGRLTLLDGDPGSGKSTLCLALASAVTTGRALPFEESKRKPAIVLLMSVEDDYRDTVRPRLDQLRADVSRVVIPNPERGLLTVNLTAEFIEQAVKLSGPALVVIDPIIAFAGRKNTDRANEVRELLAPLMSMAEKYGFACIIVRHFNKSVDARALYRGSGSVDFMAACRSAFIVTEDGEDSTKRVLSHVKNSLGAKSPSLSFYIDANGFRWGEQVDGGADELLGAQRSNTRKREKTELKAAEIFLQEALGNGPMPSNKLIEKAEGAGISRATLWRAKESLHLKASKARGTVDGEWFWRLAEDSHEGSSRARVRGNE